MNMGGGKLKTKPDRKRAYLEPDEEAKGVFVVLCPLPPAINHVIARVHPDGDRCLGSGIGDYFFSPPARP